MENIEVYKSLEEIVADIRKVNAETMRYSKELQIVFLNLAIESAHITQANGIAEIAVELKRILDKMIDVNDKLVSNDREKLNATMLQIKELLGVDKVC